MKTMQWRKVTAFVLALCMVFSMGSAAFAAQDDGTTLMLDVGQTDTITVSGEYSERNAVVSGTSAAFTYATTQDRALSGGITSAAGFDGTGNYILVTENNAAEGMLTSEPYTATLSWSGVNITGLYTHAAVTADTTEVWTIEAVTGGYAIRHDGQYLTFSWDGRLTSTGGLTSAATTLNMRYTRGYWFITNSDGHYLSNMGGDEGYFGASGFDEEGGSGWTIREVVSDGNVSTVITVTAVSAGTTTLTVGGKTYTILVRDPAAGHSYENGFCVDGRCDQPYERAARNGDVYQIANGGQLYWFAQLVNGGETDALAVLAADITVNTGDVVPERASCRDWIPIGTEGSPFAGSFDGNGYTVSGLYYNNGTENGRFVGLFGYVGERGSVSNVVLENSYFCARQDIGGIAGCNLGTITECSSAADLLATRYENVGGIAGYSKGSLIKSTNSGNITGVRNVGGIVGYLVNGQMTDCSNSGAITQKGIDSACVGGVAGRAYGDVTMERCANTGAVTGESADGAVGGVLGGVMLGNVTKTVAVTSCYNTGAVSGGGNVGGILGLAKRSVVCVTNAYNAGLITAADGYAGQIAGRVIHAGEHAPSEISGCYYMAGSDIDGPEGAAAMTEAQFASGEVAYLLNGSSSEGRPVWRQNLTGDNADATPKFVGKIVYRHEDGTYYNSDICVHVFDQKVRNENTLVSAANCTDPAVYKYSCECGEVGTETFTYGVALGHKFEDGVCTRDHCDAADPNYKIVSLTVGEEKSFADASGYYVGADTSALDPAVATVAITGTVTDTTRYLGEAVTKLESGKQYLLFNTRSQKPVTNMPATGAAAVGASAGLSLNGTKEDMAAAAVWTITASGSGYTVQDLNGNYMTIGSSTAGITTDAVTVSLNRDGGTWTISRNGAYLNHFGGSNSTCAAGWQHTSAAGDAGSQWEIYEVITATSGTSTITFTGVGEGSTFVKIGQTTYAVTVLSSAHTHTEQIIPAVPATCTGTGLTEGKKCAVCGEILAAQEVVPALGHDWKGTGCTRCGETRGNPFADVSEDSFYIDPVLWAAEQGITTGTSDTTFDPTGQCMRSVVVTFLWRAAGSPEPTSDANPFTDVKESDFFYKAVLWAVEEGITTGISPTKFAPLELCNRAMVVTFLYRTMGMPKVNATVNPFDDVQAGQFYTDAVLWAIENGITTGVSANKFAPADVCNRAQVVTFLYRALA